MTDANDSDSLLNKLLAVLAVDWAYSAWVAGDAAVLVSSREDQRSVALGVVLTGMLSGLVEAGELGDDGFVASPGAPAESGVVVAREWLAWPGFPDHPGDVCWFAATESGAVRGREVTASRTGDWDEDVWGSGDLARARALLSVGDVTLGQLLAAVEVPHASRADRSAIALGLAVEAVVAGHVTVQGCEDDAAVVRAVFQALGSPSGPELILARSSSDRPPVRLGTRSRR